MAYPPTVPSGARINTTPQVDLHPADHLAIHAALTDIVNILGATPAGADAASVSANWALVAPLGVVHAYVGASAPSGWGLCDGSAVSRETFADLYALIGTTYGDGDGSTTFNLPDLRSRFIAGKGAGTWSDTLAEIGGSADTTLVTHQHNTGAHVHPFTTGNQSNDHTHDPIATSQSILYRNIGAGSSAISVIAGSDVLTWQAADTLSTSGVSANHTHSGDTDPGGSTTPTTGNTVTTGSATNTNLPPYMTLNFIIRLT